MIVKCPGCGSYIEPVVQNGRFFCLECGEDVTDKIREIDPELVEEIAHSSIHSIYEKTEGKRRVMK